MAEPKDILKSELQYIPKDNEEYISTPHGPDDKIPIASAEQTDALTAEPNTEPTGAPTAEPNTEPTGALTAEPNTEPTGAPTAEPNTEPTDITSNIQSNSQQENYEEIINNFFKFFINLEETDENGEKFKIDWIYLKKKEDDLILYYLSKLSSGITTQVKPKTVTQILKKTNSNGIVIEKTIETYEENYANNVVKYYPNLGKYLNKDDIRNIVETLTLGNQVYSNELFNILSEKILYIIDKYKDNTSLIYDNIILILDKFDCKQYLLNIQAYYIAVKIIYINNKNFYFSTNFQYLIILYYILISTCISSQNLIKRFVGTMTYDVVPGTTKFRDDKTQDEKSYYTFMGIMIDSITNDVLKIVTLNKYNFITENDYNINKIIGKDAKNLYSIPTDSFAQNEALLNSITKGLKNITSFFKPVHPTGGKRKSITRKSITKKSITRKSIKRKSIKRKSMLNKKTVKNKKYKGGFIGIPGLTAASLYYYLGTYGPTVSGLLTGYGLDRSKLELVNVLRYEIEDNEPLINSVVYKGILNIDNPLNKSCESSSTGYGDFFGVRQASRDQAIKCEKIKEKFRDLLKKEQKNEKYNETYKILIELKGNLEKDKINYNKCTLENLKYLLEIDVENGSIIKNKISFFVNILNVYSNLYVSKCTGITKFDYSQYMDQDYNNAFQSIKDCFERGVNKTNFDKVDQQEEVVKRQIIKKLVDYLREEKIKNWETETKKLICPESKSYLAGYINKKFKEIFLEFGISVR